MIARKNLSCASKFGCALAKFGCALAGVASKATVGEVKPLDLATRANDGTPRSSRRLAYARSHDFVLNGILDPSRSPINAVMIMGQSRRSRCTPSMRHSLNGKTASEFTFSSKGDFYEQIHSDNSSKRNQATEAAAVPEQRLLRIRGNATRRGTSSSEASARVHGEERCAHHHQNTGSKTPFRFN